MSGSEWIVVVVLVAVGTAVVAAVVEIVPLLWLFGKQLLSALQDRLAGS
jgi:hypothetical protein